MKDNCQLMRNKMVKYHSLCKKMYSGTINDKNKAMIRRHKKVFGAEKSELDENRNKIINLSTKKYPKSSSNNNLQKIHYNFPDAVYLANLFSNIENDPSNE